MFQSASNDELKLSKFKGNPNAMGKQRGKNKKGKTFSSAKEMLIDSIKKDKAADKMTFATGTSTLTEETNDVDEMLEELMDQLDIPQVPDEILDEFVEIYSILDPTNEGYIDPPKLFKALHFVGFEPTEAEVMDIIDSVDINRSERIEFVELVNMMLTREESGLTEKEMKDAFCLFDTDENGIISADDIKPVFTRFGYDLDDEEMADIILVADYNKDGLVTLEDFMTAIKKQNEKAFREVDDNACFYEDPKTVGGAYEPKLEDDVERDTDLYEERINIEKVEDA